MNRFGNSNPVYLLAISHRPAGRGRAPSFVSCDPSVQFHVVIYLFIFFCLVLPSSRLSNHFASYNGRQKPEMKSENSCH